MKIRIAALITAAVIASFLFTSLLPSYADTVLRKDGRRLNGDVVEHNADWVIIRTKHGEVIIDKSRVTSVLDKEGNALAPKNDPGLSAIRKSAYNQKMSDARRSNSTASPSRQRWIRFPISAIVEHEAGMTSARVVCKAAPAKSPSLGRRIRCTFGPPLSCRQRIAMSPNADGTLE